MKPKVKEALGDLDPRQGTQREQLQQSAPRLMSREAQQMLRKEEEEQQQLKQQQRPQAGEAICAVTGVPSSVHPLEPCPVWRFDATAKKLQLLGMLPVAKAVAAARHIDKLQGEQYEVAVKLLGELYGERPWESDKMLQYIGYVEKQREQIKRESWQLDLSLLSL